MAFARQGARAKTPGLAFAMSIGIMERQLLRGINADGHLASRGITAQNPPAGGVVVARRGHVRGTWAWENGAFVLTVAGAAAPAVEVETVAEAVQYTREHLCPDP